jgi:hypothetical protein
MARWAIRDIAALPGLSTTTLEEVGLGARKPLRKIQMPMQFAGGHCIISGLMLTSRRNPALRSLVSLRPARQFLLQSRPLLWPNKEHLRQRLQLHLQLLQGRHRGRTRLRIRAREGIVGSTAPRWNALSSTRWQQAPRPRRLIICAFGDCLRHRSELSTASLRPDWHFRRSRSTSLVAGVWIARPGRVRQ